MGQVDQLLAGGDGQEVQQQQHHEARVQREWHYFNVNKSVNKNINKNSKTVTIIFRRSSLFLEVVSATAAAADVSGTWLISAPPPGSPKMFYFWSVWQDGEIIGQWKFCQSRPKILPNTKYIRRQKMASDFQKCKNGQISQNLVTLFLIRSACPRCTKWCSTEIAEIQFDSKVCSLLFLGKILIFNLLEGVGGGLPECDVTRI